MTDKRELSVSQDSKNSREGILYCLALGAMMKAILFSFGFAAFEIFKNRRIHSLQEGFSLWNKWDGLRYYDVAVRGYEEVYKTWPSIIKFPPLLPWTTKFLAPIFAGHIYLCMMVLSGIATLISGVLLYKLIRLDYPEDVARRSVWYFLIFPTSYFLHIGFSESFFVVLMLGAFLAARKKHWWFAGILGGLSALARINAAALILALAMEFFIQIREGEKWKIRAVSFLFMGMGCFAFLWHNQSIAGNPFAFLHLQMSDLSRQLCPPWVGIMNTVKTLSWRTPADSHMVVFQELLFAALALGVACCGIKKWRLSYSVWMFANLGLILSNTFILSIPRYVLVLFPIPLYFALLKPEGYMARLVQAWCFLSWAVFVIRFVTGMWAF